MSWRLVLIAWIVVLIGGPAVAARRVALVIGNDRYPNLSDGQQLHNAISDARLMKQTLTGLGFVVSDGENLGRSDMVDKISDFAASLEADDIALFFYAGHGVALNGQNYVLPTDIPLPHASSRNEEQRLADHAVSENEIREHVSGAKVAVIVLDSCRDNPLAASTGRSLGMGRGLARPTETRGVLSIYSAGVGQQALDRLGETDPNPNSVFTRVFAEKLKLRGVGLRGIAFATQQEVASLAEAAGRTQFPGVYSQIVGDIYLNGSADAPKASPQAAHKQTPEEFEESRRRVDAFFAKIEGNATNRQGPQRQAALAPGDILSPTPLSGVYGMDLSTLSPAFRGKYGIKDSIGGVAVTRVDPSWAYNSGVVKPGDVIVRVLQGAPGAMMQPSALMRTPTELLSKLEDIKTAGQRSVMLIVANGQNAGRFVRLSFLRQ